MANFFDQVFINNHDINLDLKPWKIISSYSRYDNNLTLITSLILEDEVGDYFFIKEDHYKISDVSKMPYYIKEDWIKHNTKRLNILTINEHIKEISTNGIINDDNEKVIEELKIIRRDLIIKGII